MRIAHFVQRYPPALGGSEAYFARLGRFLARAGDRVTVFTTTAVDLEAFWSPRGRCLPPTRTVEDGVAVRRYALCRWPARRYLLKPLSLVPHRTWQCLTFPWNPVAPRMWADAARPDAAYDVVHATAFPYAWPIASARRLARRLRVPFLVTPFLHLGDPTDPADRTRRGYLHPALLSLLRSADRVFVQTEGERAAVRDCGVPEKNIVLQGMGVDRAECTGGNRQAVRRGWGAADGDVVVGHLANQSIEKGTVDLLLAAERLWARGSRFHVVLAGPDMPNFRRFWQAHRPSGPVRRLGVLDEQAKRDFFAGLDVFALPSRSDSFGLVLLEAWENGVPNVAYRAGGPAEVIHDGVDGLLARPGDVAGLADALGRLVASPGLREKLGGDGRAQAARDFRLEDKLALVRRTYQNAAGDGELPPPPAEDRRPGRDHLPSAFRTT